MTKDQNDSVNSFLGKGEKISDNVVSMIYSESLVKSIESLDFMKKLMESAFIKGLNDFGKGWFKQVFVILGYIAIIGGLINIFYTASYLFGIYSYFVGPLYVVAHIIMSLILIISGFGMIKFKKWFPFITIVSFVGNVIVTVAFPVYSYGVGRGGSIGYVIISLIIFLVGFALILKNKELFKN